VRAVEEGHSLAFEWKGKSDFDALFAAPHGPTMMQARFESVPEGTRLVVEQPETRPLHGWASYDEWMADAWEEALQVPKARCEAG
jgi:hypothetical protein